MKTLPQATAPALQRVITLLATPPSDATAVKTITAPSPTSWWIYLIQTRQHHLYCGISNAPGKRFAAHQLGKGAKYLRGKGPLHMLWCHPVDSHSSALKLEYAIKKLSKKQKLQLISLMPTPETCSQIHDASYAANVTLVD